ncbi:MAG TPA: acetate--CoA ligase [Candidatus Nitrosopelagicus sp.]|nr:acetate--CoA ligase [Candidatus Nitrosopelagicus sp.]
MDVDSYDIGLGHSDTKVRTDAESDFVLFWGMQAKKLSWFKPWTKTLEWNLPFAKWFVGGKINASYNTLDVHQNNRAQKPAILWEGEDGATRTVTYQDLFHDVCKFANVLKSLGVKKGDRVTVYLPMIPELPVTMLACSRIGAIHVVVFSGFSTTSLRDRIDDSKSKVIITADVGFRKGSIIKLQEIVDEAIKDLDFVKHVVVLKRTNSQSNLSAKHHLWNKLMDNSSDECESEELDSTHPLYILYTSGTTGKPKGVLHGTGGYLTHLYSTFEWAFDIKDSDIFFCTADIGWVTGHSYVVYGPLLHGATVIMYEGVPDHPTPSRMWEIIQRYGVTIFYTTPTALRMFMKFGDTLPNSFDLSSLRLLGTVGEPINPDVWRWYFTIIGKSKCPIVDTWWQTETGGMMLSPLPGLETISLKPGSATKPIPGTDIAVVDENGHETASGKKGYLVIRNPWPGMLMTLWGDDEKYRNVYWSKYKNTYYPGDYAIKDSDGYFWLLGRADDILKVAGHRIGTAEIESALVSHIDVVEAAVCGIPDEIKGDAIIVFAILKQNAKKDHDKLRSELIEIIRNGIGPIATPQQIHFVTKLPKTRSGKIMRRLLKAIAKNEKIGDISTLEDATAVHEIQASFDELEKTEGKPE